MKHWFLAVVLFAIMGLSGCGWLYEAGNSTASNGSDLTEADLHIKNFEFMNQDEKTISSDDLEGTYWLANMIFTRCPSVCPLMTPNMLNIQGEAEKRGIDMNFVSFTVDPEFDNPERLKNYGEGYGVDFSNWHFLTGYDDEEIRALADESFLSVVEKAPEEDDIIHSTAFFLIDPNGQVIRKYDGLENDADPVIEDVEVLTEQ